nr:hypothetical protein [Tanacetum cinerariifolium]
MSELRCNLFSGTVDEDAHEHVRRVLEITNLFHILGVTRDAVMRRVFPITRTGEARRWKNMLPVGSIGTWDLLEKAFIRKYCPPLKTAKKLEEIQNFKQGMDETLYQAWERLDIPSHKMVDSQGLIPMMPPTQALKSVQNMADHSQNWYNEATTWQGSSHNSNDIVFITKRVDNFKCDMQKLQESIYAIQVGFKICEEVHLTKERPLKEYGKIVEQVKYIGFLEETINKFMEESNKKQAAFDEWIRKFRDDMNLNLRMLDAATKNLPVKAEQLTHDILTNDMVDKVKKQK